MRCSIFQLFFLANDRAQQDRCSQPTDSTCPSFPLACLLYDLSHLIVSNKVFFVLGIGRNPPFVRRGRQLCRIWFKQPFLSEAPVGLGIASLALWVPLVSKSGQLGPCLVRRDSSVVGRTASPFGGCFSSSTVP